MSEVRIVGTAHVSQKSVEEVREAVLEFNPDVIAVELDPPRYAALKKQAAAPNVSEVIESGNFNQLLVQWILSYLQRKVGLDVGVEPGAEMKAAINEAESRGIGIGLIDRDLRITLHRFWHALSLFEKIRMVYILAISVMSTSEEKIDVEELKKQDVMEMAMAEFRKFSPNGAKALIDERDAYLADQINRLRMNNERVLVVIGAGHVDGVNKYLDAPETLPPMEELVKDIKPVPWGTIFGIGVTLIFVLFIAAIAFSGVGIEVLFMALVYWVVIHGALTAIFTLAAKGHPHFCADRVCGVLVYRIKSTHRGGLVLCNRRGKDQETCPIGLQDGSSRQRVSPKCGASRCSGWSLLRRWQTWEARLARLRTYSSLSRSSMWTRVSL